MAEEFNLHAYCAKNGLNYIQMYNRVVLKHLTIKEAELDIQEKNRIKGIKPSKEDTEEMYCRRHKKNINEIRNRMEKYNISFEEAINKDLSYKLNGLNHAKHLVIYKNEEMSLTNALKEFFKDNGLALTSGGSIFKELKKGGTPQEVFDEYCLKILKKFKRI